jgi:hypothetical protein
MCEGVRCVDMCCPNVSEYAPGVCACVCSCILVCYICESMNGLFVGVVYGCV